MDLMRVARRAATARERVTLTATNCELGSIEVELVAPRSIKQCCTGVIGYMIMLVSEPPEIGVFGPSVFAHEFH
eukprot:COSAG02_NODE_40952_length_399_cov_1.636667_1_plen_74_part_00